MTDSTYICISNKSMNITDFYTVETPPSSSTSKDSTDESLSSFQTKTKLKLSRTNIRQTSNHPSICSTLQSNLISNSIPIKDDEFDCSPYDDNHTPLRRSLGNTKLKTRQDVRRFRKFLKRHYDLTSMALVDIDPDKMRNYLIDYLTSIRTRKGLKYDPETLRSYYLSIQRFLKDSNYPYCLRNSPQFSQCRDLIIQMRKEKNQIKVHDLSLLETTEIKNKRITMKKNSILQQKYQTSMNHNLDKQQIQLDDQSNSSKAITPIILHNCVASTKDLLPSSSLPPRKRQQMKYFLEFGSPHDFILLPEKSSSSIQTPPFTLSSDAYLLLAKFTHLSSSLMFLSSLNSSPGHPCTHHLERLLDESPTCGYVQRLMLTTLCHEWTGDIRLIHTNLRPELHSFLPHILVLNILSSKYSY
ncbi:unnamed protein product [Rotaria magnacalcarata]|uniref:Uncharacterized protein n=2 Tax=Rotaria magnacalcarata TaxID=392030 RepID=A0A819I9K7_9BILA|nr:unnamed protein product [Rotaria magnacalcarata]CAF1604184.1 unnamed protein product [Rotaria magnacalcarata]CAF1938789.1 unnamed protein product [Rotaria magnacalcarata]CAF1949591.1 unnamed protein product [Rotaria magnacalcarata]CAF3736847.1 unnamed protein product [Rotaria magnacalcarata]